MIKVHACFDIFNEAQFISSAIESVLWADQIILVDGIREGHPSETVNSNDGTIDIIKSYMKNCSHIKLIIMDKAAGGYEKIDAYRSLVPYGDYILRVDGDEIIYGEPDKLKPYIKNTNFLPLYSIREMLDLGNNIKPGPWQPRVIKHTPEVKITWMHLALSNDFNYSIHPKQWLEPSEANLPFLSFLHKNELRWPGHQDAEKKRLKYFYEYTIKKGII